MLPFDPAAVKQNVSESSTEDLLDRVTAYRSGMEPDAIWIIEAELESRGVDRAAICRPEGFAYRCSFCRRPAVVRRWGWHWLGGLVPVLPRMFSYCSRHADEPSEGGPAEVEE
jgi:hypothetical protein